MSTRANVYEIFPSRHCSLVTLMDIDDTKSHACILAVDKHSHWLSMTLTIKVIWGRIAN